VGQRRQHQLPRHARADARDARGRRFEITSDVDSSDESLEWFRAVRARIERDGPPPVTFAAFLGDSFGQMAANQVTNLAERRIRTVMLTCVRPS